MRIILVLIRFGVAGCPTAGGRCESLSFVFNCNVRITLV